MPFGNPVVGGDELIRNDVRSQNYVQGLSGWRIGRNGSAEFEDTTLRGTLAVPTLKVSQSLKYKGIELQSMFDPLPGGLVAYGGASPGTQLWGTQIEGPVAQMSFLAKANRSYIIRMNGLEMDCSTAGRSTQWFMTRTIDGSTPLRTSPILNAGVGNIPYTKNGSSGNVNGAEAWYGNTTGADVTLKVHFYVAVIEGDTTSTVSTWAGQGCNFYALDIGPTAGTGLIGGSVIFNNPGSSGNPTTTYDQTWFAQTSQSYGQNGLPSPATNANIYAYQGDGSAVGNPGGDTIGLHFFDSASIRAALVGATILNTYIYVDNLHSYLNSGITAWVGTHGSDPTPGSVPARSEHRWNLALSPRGADGWTGDLTAALGVEWQNGSTRGHTFGYGGVGNINEYGIFNMSGIRIVYKK